MASDKILMHVPYYFLREQDLASGSRVFPHQMYLAFQEIGYKVDLITGGLTARLRKVMELVKSLKLDEYLFCFSALSTYPANPIIDYAFYLLLWANKVPTGIYYTDAYWKFPNLFPLPAFKRLLLLLRYWSDLLFFPCIALAFFFPSQPLADLFSLKQPKVPLPPGGKFLASPDHSTRSMVTKAVYIGGIRERYGLKVMLEALVLVNRDSSLELELVCRPAEFARERAALDNYLDLPWLRVHHVSGKALAPVYQQSDIGLIALLRNVYNDMAMPVKLFEYLSYGLPVVATDCTEMADFIARNRVGLIAEDNAESLAEKILQLVRDCDLYEELRRNVQRALENGNLWTDRAKLVAQQLTALDKRC